MKTLLVLFLLASCNGGSEKSVQESDATQRALPPVQKEDPLVPNNTQTTDVKEEDCDDKAKKPIEIKEETISLSGNTGCTLEEAH